jgi:hypothetical protein
VRVGFRDVALAFFVCMIDAGVSAAHVVFPSVVDRVLDIRSSGAAMSPLVLARTRVEVADAQLYGIAGLRTTGLRASRVLGTCVLGGEVAQIGSPVGSESRIAFEVAYASHADWMLGVRAGLARLAIAGATLESRPIAGLVSQVEVGAVTTRVDVENEGLDATRAMTMCVAVAARVSSGTVVSSVRADGPGAIAIGVAASVTLHPAFALLVGYDDGTETFSGAVAVRVHACEVCAGVYRHAVLGLSQGVSLVWSR